MNNPFAEALKDKFEDIAKKIFMDEVHEEALKENERRDRWAKANKERREAIKKEADFAPYKIIFDDMAVNKTNLMYHLICAYSPMSEAHRILDKPKEEKKCCICEKGLISVQEVILKGSDVVLESIRKELEANSRGEAFDSTAYYQEQFGNKMLGYFSEKSNKCFCAKCMSNFYEWLSRKILCGDNLVESALKKVRKSQGWNF